MRPRSIRPNRVAKRRTNSILFDYHHGCLALLVVEEQDVANAIYTATERLRDLGIDDAKVAATVPAQRLGRTAPNPQAVILLSTFAPAGPGALRLCLGETATGRTKQVRSGGVRGRTQQERLPSARAERHLDQSTLRTPVGTHAP